MAERDPFMDAEDATSLKPSRAERVRRLGVMISVPVLIVAGAVTYYIANDHYVSTDNAYVKQDKVSISPEVSGRIVEVAVRENQRVKAGDLLFRLDPEPYRIAAQQADAAVAAAVVKVGSLRSDLQSSNVDIAAAQEDVAFYEKEYARQKELMRTGFTTQARLQAAEHALADARSRVAVAIAEENKKQADLATAPEAPGVNPAVLAGRAQKAKALLDLSRTELRAPVDGIVTQSSRLLVGQMMTASLPALTIVAVDRSWVEANFKETDLKNMRVGQPAELTFDAYPDLKLKGHVASLGAGTGSEFSVLPAQNANGNWVKVTQRIPVRIAIDDKPSRLLIAGLSTHVRIDTGK